MRSSTGRGSTGLRREKRSNHNHPKKPIPGAAKIQWPKPPALGVASTRCAWTFLRPFRFALASSVNGSLPALGPKLAVVLLSGLKDVRSAFCPNQFRKSRWKAQRLRRFPCNLLRRASWSRENAVRFEFCGLRAAGLCRFGAGFGGPKRSIHSFTSCPDRLT